MDQMQSNNPQQFWRKRNKLGPKKLKKIPMKILVRLKTKKDGRKPYVRQTGVQDPPDFDGAVFNDICATKCECTNVLWC